MDTFLQLPASRRLLAFQQVDETMGLQAVSVEKDFWVCWTLRELFSLPGIGDHLTFKGGTSLSKAWKLIERFSEDIDIIVDKEVLGFGGDAAPDQAPSNKQRKARLEALMDACREWVQGTLQPALESRIRELLGGADWQLEVDPDMPDGQCLLFQYPSVFPPGVAGYVRPVVKIELGARSDDWPHEEKPILPYVTGHFPAFDPAPAFPVRVLFFRFSWVDDTTHNRHLSADPTTGTPRQLEIRLRRNARPHVLRRHPYLQRTHGSSSRFRIHLQRHRSLIAHPPTEQS